MSYGPKSLADMAAEVREINIEKGWRSATGETTNSFGDYIALLHSELSEALEAYRDHRLDDATGRPKCKYPECPDFGDPDFGEATCPEVHASTPKPEGVGSEFADVLIRLLDTCDIYGIDLEAEYRRKVAFNRTRSFQHGGRTITDGAPA